MDSIPVHRCSVRESLLGKCATCLARWLLGRFVSGVRGLLVLVASAGMMRPAVAEPPPAPVLLLQQGDTPIGAPPGTSIVADIHSTRAAGATGFAAMIGLRGPHTPYVATVDAVWGSLPNEVDPRVLVHEHTTAQNDLLLEQVRFENGFGYNAQGRVAYSALIASGSCSPLATSPGYLDSVWTDGTLLAISGGGASASPSRLYRFVSRPGITGVGHVFWHGGASESGAGVPTWEAIMFRRGTSTFAWLESGTSAGGGVVTSIGPFAVSTLGSFAISAVTLQNGDDILMRLEWDENGAPVATPLLIGGIPARRGRSLAVVGALSGEKWSRMLHIDAAEGASGLPKWIVLAETATSSARQHAIVMDNGLMTFVTARTGDVYEGGRVLTGRPEHIAINAQGDLAAVWSVILGQAPNQIEKEALFVNARLMIETGDQVPLRDGVGVLRNILGSHTVSISDRHGTPATTSVYFIASVEPMVGQSPTLDRVVALYRIDADVSHDTSCASDWNNDGAVNSSDISAFIESWLDDVNAQPPTTIADFNHDGSTNSADIAAFLAAWLSDLTAGC